jgi:protein-S-isoprenylcysteine O-methyltransferase Ste14
VSRAPRYRPTTWWWAGAAVAVVLHVLGPGLRLVIGPWRATGGLLFLWGIVAMLRCVRHLERHGTTHTMKAPAALVIDGPFAWSRNPMYVAMTLALLGVAVALGSMWALGGPVAFVWVLDRSIVPWEEHSLATTFGDAYETYRARVRRWL